MRQPAGVLFVGVCLLWRPDTDCVSRTQRSTVLLLGRLVRDTLQHVQAIANLSIADSAACELVVCGWVAPSAGAGWRLVLVLV